MQIKFNPFPVVYLNTRCKKHDCSLEIRLGEAKKVGNHPVVGANISVVRCQTGGGPNEADCMSDWEFSMLGMPEVNVGP